jgi:hypothetical protein
MRTLICLLLCLAAGPATGQPAVCRVDLNAGTFAWTTPTGRSLEPLHVEGAERKFAELDSLLAAGDEADALRALLGAQILQPVWSEIGHFGRWRIVPTEVRAVPGLLAGLTVLALPDGLREAAFQRVEVTLDWPEPLRAPQTRVREASGSLLLSAPFTPDVEPVNDDPDTLRRALQGAAKTVRLIPRNESDATTLRRALEDSQPALWWFRGDQEQLAGLQPAFGALPGLVVWTLPGRGGVEVPQLSPMTFASGGEGPGCVVASVRPIPESTLAPLARHFADGMARGLSCAAALHEAQRAAVGSGLAAASSLVLIGDHEATVDLRRASWLKRLFH